MQGIYAAAIVASLLSLAAWGTFLWQLSKSGGRATLLLLLVTAIPMSPAAFHLIRMPLRSICEKQWGRKSTVYRMWRLCEAPLTEEPAKLVPLFLLLATPLRNRLRQQSSSAIALALGIGFGIGEIWLLAQLLHTDPNIAGRPVSQLGGFVGERLIVCVTHAGFTISAVVAIRQGIRWIPIGLGVAMLLHFLGNFPIFLMERDVGGLGKNTWMLLITLWLAAYLFLSLILLAVFHFGLKDVRRIFFGRATCPSCGEAYSRPIFGLNAGMKRYERCPKCGKWHWIDAKDNLPP